MKKNSKWFALVLAGLLVLLPFFVACDADSGSDDDKEDEVQTNSQPKDEIKGADDEPTKTDDEPDDITDEFAEFRNLSPEEVYEALCSASEIMYRVETRGSSPGTIGEYIQTIVRDGGKVKYEIDSEDDTQDVLFYGDMEKNVTYYQSNDIWEVEESEENDGTTWNSLHMRERDPLFEDDNYSRIGDQYEFSEKALNEYDHFKGITMTSKDTTYIFELVYDFQSQDADYTATMTIQFDDMSVELPDINNSAS